VTLDPAPATGYGLFRGWDGGLTGRANPATVAIDPRTKERHRDLHGQGDRRSSPSRPASLSFTATRGAESPTAEVVSVTNGTAAP